MRISNFSPGYFIIFLLLFSFSSCVEEGITSDPTLSPKDFTHLNILLTDTPKNAEEINIEITSLKIITNKSPEPIKMSTYSGVYNLLDYQDGNRVLLAESDLLGVQHISEIIFELGENNNIKVGSIVFPLIKSSNIEELLRVHGSIFLDEVLVKDLVVDFDAEKSITTREDGSYLLHPYIRITD